jgi:hypothetical protein
MKMMKIFEKSEIFTPWIVYKKIDNNTLWQNWNENDEKLSWKVRVETSLWRLKVKHY